MKTFRRKRCDSRIANIRLAGFTLVEILIVVIILSILAAIIVPKFSDASMQAKEGMLSENLRVMRTQIGAYRAQHWDVSPGYDVSGTPSEATFVAQMTQCSDAEGNTNAERTEDFPFGPYLRAVPENPLSNVAAINVLGDAEEIPADLIGSDFGWLYKPGENIWLAYVPDEG